MNDPLVTVNILSYNRKDELRYTLQKVFEQNYKNIEVIVVDNASDDGTPEMVSKEFPNAILLGLQKNIGIAGWNEGFKIANGNFVLVLDDDSYPDKNTIKRGVQEFGNNSNLGIVAYNIFNTRFNISETSELNKDRSKNFIGCGALIRNEIFSKIGYYDDLMFVYCNELDFSIRLYNYGYIIKYLEQAVVFHSQSPLARANNQAGPYLSNFRYSQYFINHCIFILKHFYFIYSVKYSIKWILNRMIICFKYPRMFIYFFFSLVKLVIITPKILKKRKPCSKNVQSFFWFGNVSLIDRLYFPGFKKNNWINFRSKFTMK